MKIIRVVGGLGSQMMAYALGMAIKKKNKSEKVIVDFSAYHKKQRFDHNGAEIERVFGVHEDSVGFLANRVLYGKKLPLRLVRKFVRASRISKHIDAADNKYNFDCRVFDSNRWRFVEIHQCWTSYKYFQGIENLIKSTFIFPETFISAINNKLCELITCSNSVSLHVRRGDYVNNKIHGDVLELAYYKHALEIILNKVNDPRFFIFSDDPLYVKEKIMPLMPCARVHIIDHNKKLNSWIDMALMSKCLHHVIPNSSFSWWGAFLGSHNNQVVVAPKYWANVNSNVELSDMNFPHWNLVDNRHVR